MSKTKWTTVWSCSLLILIFALSGCSESEANKQYLEDTLQYDENSFQSVDEETADLEVEGFDPKVGQAIASLPVWKSSSPVTTQLPTIMAGIRNGQFNTILNENELVESDILAHNLSTNELMVSRLPLEESKREDVGDSEEENDEYTKKNKRKRWSAL